MKLSDIKKAYFVGIKGVGMTALAQVFLARGIEIVGSDTGEEFFTDKILKNLGVKVIQGFDVSNVPEDADIAVVSAAYLNTPEVNPEVEAIRDGGLEILTYAQALGLLFEKKYGIAVAGTHGKSTTTAMLGLALEAAGLDPNVIAGAEVLKWRSNARVGDSKYLVVEADEYKSNFLNYSPQVLVLTNMEYDHPDFFKDFKSYRKTFEEMIKKIPSDGLLVYNGKDKNLLEVIDRASCDKVDFNQYRDSGLSLNVPGEHNLLNAEAAMAVADYLGADKNSVKTSLAEFEGTRRRFEKKLETDRFIFIDDYAHHPTEVRATLKAAKEKYPESKIVSVFQPHTFSRTEALLDDFAEAFGFADEVLVLDIYGSAREKKGSVSSKDLIEKIEEKSGLKPVYKADLEAAADYIKDHLDSGVILTMGAGDVYKLILKFEVL